MIIEVGGIVIVIVVGIVITVIARIIRITAVGEFGSCTSAQNLLIPLSPTASKKPDPCSPSLHEKAPRSGTPRDALPFRRAISREPLAVVRNILLEVSLSVWVTPGLAVNFDIYG